MLAASIWELLGVSGSFWEFLVDFDEFLIDLIGELAHHVPLLAIRPYGNNMGPGSWDHGSRDHGTNHWEIRHSGNNSRNKMQE